MTIQQILFLVLAGITTAGAVGVLSQKNPLYGAFSLIGSFIGLSAIYIMLGAEFLGVMQIVVYAGAIMVLFVFVIMLLNLRYEDTLQDKNKSLHWFVIPLGVGLLVELLSIISEVKIEPITSSAQNVGTVESIGRGLLTDYLLPFEATSVLILMAIIGSMYLARREKE